MKPLNIVFAGTPDFAATHLQALLSSEHNVIAVYSQPDRPAGRGKKLQASPVKQMAEAAGVTVYQPSTLRDETAQQQLSSLNADVMVVVAYGLILPQVVLDTPKFGCLNVHGSLLPRWRGAAPIQRAIWAGDKRTGVTVMQMDKGLDTGAMLHTESLDITPCETSASLYDKLAEIGPKALLYSLDNLTQLTPEIQQEQNANYAQKLSKEEAKIDWHMQATQLERNVRAFNPWPVAYFDLAQDEQSVSIKVWQASVEEIPNSKNNTPGEILRADKHGVLVQTQHHALLLTQLQIPGKKAMSASDILNARQDWFVVGKVLA